MSIGFRDKLYWRPVTAFWCCFKRCATGGYISLCGRAVRRRSGGQAITRPPSIRRCARCDGEEMQRRGKEEGMPTSDEWDVYAGP